MEDGMEDGIVFRASGSKGVVDHVKLDIPSECIF
jgi:hypothetical protein